MRMHMMAYGICAFTCVFYNSKSDVDVCIYAATRGAEVPLSPAPWNPTACSDRYKLITTHNNQTSQRHCLKHFVSMVVITGRGVVSDAPEAAFTMHEHLPKSAEWIPIAKWTKHCMYCACTIAKYYFYVFDCIHMYSLSCKVNTCSQDTVFLCITICKGGMWQSVDQTGCHCLDVSG